MLLSVTVITTGRELLTGAVEDRNGPVLCRHLASLGLRVQQIITIGDDTDRCFETLRASVAGSDIVIMTGGLGPTGDDVTRSAIMRLVPVDMIPFPPALERLEKTFRGRGRTVDDADITMTLVPVNAIPFGNSAGIAPGFAMGITSRWIIALPGPPAEMAAVLTEGVTPWLKNIYGLKSGESSLTYNVIWTKESDIDRVMIPLAKEMKLEYGITAQRGRAAVTLYGSGILDMENDITARMDTLFGRNLLLKHCASVEEELVHLLSKAGLSLGLAESCTGGLVGKRITDIPGASRVFNGSAVTYADAAKVNLLNVKRETLERTGAVSVETAREMAAGARDLFRTDTAISITGIAGPDGGTDDKPVGTVCFGFAVREDIFTERLLLTGPRGAVREGAALFAMDRLRRELRSLET